MDNPFEILVNEFRELKEAVLRNNELTQQALSTERNHSDSEPEQNFTPKELAKYLKCHVETIRLKKRNGELPFHQHGRKIIFKKSEIDALTANPVFKSGL